MLYEDRNAEQAAADAVRMACNLGTSYVPPKSGAVKPWADVTNLLHPGDLGPVGTAPWKRCVHAANHFLNDATGLEFPRAGTLAAKLDFIFDMNDDVRCLVSLCFPVHVISSPPSMCRLRSSCRRNSLTTQRTGLCATCTLCS